MGDKNFNQSNQSHQSGQDWERERNRYDQDNDWSQNRGDSSQNYQSSNYGNSQNRGWNQSSRDIGYSGDSAHGMGNENQGDFNRVNYLPDNDDNRGYSGQNYGSSPYGSSGNYGSRTSGMQSNQGGYGREGRGSSYGNMSGDYNRQGTGNRSDYGSSYGNQYGNESDWGRRHSQQTGSGNWGSDYGRQDWGRGNVDTGSWGSQSRDYGNRNYGGDYNNMGSDYNRQRNRYGGDTSNHGNANQGGVQNDWWERTKDKVSSWFSDDDDNNRRRDRGSYSGPHRGKGPSDYRRSQDRIREDICDRLTDDDMVDASHVRVQIEDDAVILSGTVNSREEKRRAEELVESISGVRNVENRLRVGSTGSGDISSRDYTGNTDRAGGIGKSSGTTNEVIRDTNNDRSGSSDRGKSKNS
jgi:osmotically-inducible protein OsmY